MFKLNEWNHLITISKKDIYSFIRENKSDEIFLSYLCRLSNISLTWVYQLSIYPLFLIMTIHISFLDVC